MTQEELHQRRREKWRVAAPEQAVRTLEDAREFIESVGFATMYPARPAVLAPTFFGAYLGQEENLPLAKDAFRHPESQPATDLMVRLLREKSAFEANLFPETNFLVAASVFPYFYGLAGDRNPKGEKKDPKLSPLAGDAFAVIQREGPIAKTRLRDRLGGALSDAAMERALDELWSRLKIIRVDYSPEHGASWDMLFRWAPEAVNEGAHLSVPESLSALLSKYLDAVVAAEQKEVEEFFGHLVPRSKVREAINALLGARELSFLQVGPRSMVQVTPPRTPASRRQPIARRPHTKRA
ncbi:MAG TPA: hypothetical protein VMS96_07975 [Terriglobales bacterium]|nr:hypothetical protein [Terriglobales bacterium]